MLCRDASGLAREPTYQLNFMGYSWQPTKLSLYTSSWANPLTPLVLILALYSLYTTYCIVFGPGTCRMTWSTNHLIGAVATRGPASAKPGTSFQCHEFWFVTDLMHMFFNIFSHALICNINTKVPT